MPQYEVNAPDGKTYTVNSPEGASEQDAIGYVQKNFYSQPEKKADLPASERIGKGLRDPIDGGAQLLTKLLPDGFVQAGNKLNNFLADKTGLVGRLPEGGVDQQVRDNEAAYQAARGPDAGFDGARLLGNVISPANLGLGGALAAPKAASLLTRVGMGAVGGAASGALNPVAGEGDFMDDKLKQMGLGAAFGGATPMATSAIARLISPKASANPNVQLLKNEGVTPTIGQALGGRVNTIEEKLMSVPILGDAIASARGKSLNEFNNAAINRASGKIGAKIEGSGQSAIKEAGNVLSQSYDNALSTVKFVKFDQQFAQDFAQLKGMAQSLTGPLRNKFNTKIDEVLAGRTSGTGSMLGDTYKKVDSELGQLASRYGKSSVASEQELGDAFAQAQSLLKQQMMRSNPKVAEQLGKTDAGWANLVRIEQAGKSGKNAEGVFTPGQLNMAIAGSDQSVRGRAVARGTALMQDLGNAGQQVLGNKVPDSGTAGRLAMGASTLLGGGYINPLIPAGLLGGAGLYMGPMRGLLSGAVTARPESAKAVAEALRKASPALVPLSAQMGQGLLN
ncbi:MAG: hypothetical protein H0X13_15495 [Ramlibacter sp.]|nr:hypothetical protein [Ramlibacter sp.]